MASKTQYRTRVANTFKAQGMKVLESWTKDGFVYVDVETASEGLVTQRAVYECEMQGSKLFLCTLVRSYTVTINEVDQEVDQDAEPTIVRIVEPTTEEEK